MRHQHDLHKVMEVVGEGEKLSQQQVACLFLYFLLSLSPCPLLAKQPKAYILLGLSQWYPVPSQIEEAHLSSKEMQLPSRKRNQRTEDS